MATPAPSLSQAESRTGSSPGAGAERAPRGFPEKLPKLQKDIPSAFPSLSDCRRCVGAHWHTVPSRGSPAGQNCACFPRAVLKSQKQRQSLLLSPALFTLRSLRARGARRRPVSPVASRLSPLDFFLLVPLFLFFKSGERCGRRTLAAARFLLSNVPL